ncbi:MAG: TRAP transporter small permease subunit [Burkholderiales bacterium]
MINLTDQDGWLYRIARVMVIASGWWLLAIVAMTCIEIMGRKIFGFSLQAVDELGAYSLAVTSAFGFTLTLLNRGHTRVDFLMTRLPAGAQAGLNALAMLLLAALALFAAWRGANVLAESIEFQSRATTPLQTPLWIPQSLWLAGITLFAIACAMLAGHAVGLLVRDRARLNTLYGPMTLDEEIRHEVADLGQGVKGELRRDAGSLDAIEAGPRKEQGRP